MPIGLAGLGCDSRVFPGFSGCPPEPRGVSGMSNASSERNTVGSKPGSEHHPGRGIAVIRTEKSLTFERN